MDEHLENMDWSQLIKKHGVLKSAKYKKINLDLPPHMIDQIDLLAAKIGISRQPLIKVWIHERLKEELLDEKSD
ncbi:MAG: CopG family transcriptional regulator [Deltaproteobacteria bacterium]|nr:MAG: CopG family transcriptional regulator [Deltaproteobacteria bacterium]